MVDKSKRGKKLKCQNEDCALKFYDVNVNQPDCPTCGTAYDHDAPKELVGSASNHPRRRQAPVFQIVAPQESIETTNQTDDEGFVRIWPTPFAERRTCPMSLSMAC